MARFTVRGGDFDRGIGLVEQGLGFVLREKGKLVRGLTVERTALAVPREVEKMGGLQRFGPRGTLDGVRKDLKSGEGMFIVQFTGDKVLLATADAETCNILARVAPFPPDTEPTGEAEDRVSEVKE